MQNWKSYLQLIRLPAVFTALADVFLGFVLTHGSLQPYSRLIPLAVASACLYCAGMVFNDLFDRKIDVQLRPHRPIPSGRIKVAHAFRFGLLLIFGGLVAAERAGRVSLMLAGALALFAIAYDAGGKKTAFGPVLMGVCRALNVLLGASAVEQVTLVFSPPQSAAAIGLGCYIAGVTWFARNEAEQSSRRQLILASLLINGALGGLFWFSSVWDWPGKPTPQVIAIMLGVIVLTIDRRLLAAISDPIPAKVQNAVRLMLLSLIVLDASLILFHTGTDQIQWAASTLTLLIPAAFLGRWLKLT